MVFFEFFQMKCSAFSYRRMIARLWRLEQLCGARWQHAAVHRRCSCAILRYSALRTLHTHTLLPYRLLLCTCMLLPEKTRFVHGGACRQRSCSTKLMQPPSTVKASAYAAAKAAAAAATLAATEPAVALLFHIIIIAKIIIWRMRTAWNLAFITSCCWNRVQSIALFT